MNAKKKSLGRGLDALLGAKPELSEKVDSDKGEVVESIGELLISAIETNPYQPRTEIEKTQLAELAQSISEQGIIQPVTVRKLKNGSFQLISGERRLRASKLAGLKKIPAYIRIVSDQQAMQMALVENIQRADLNPIDMAIGFQRIIEEFDVDHIELAQKMGKDRSTISNYLRLLKLPAEVQLALKNNQITIGHARALINLPSISDQVKVLRQILGKQLSVREVEAITNKIKETTGLKKKASDTLSEKLENIQKNLQAKFSQKLRIKRNNKGRGTIVIPFENDDELESITGKLK